MKQNDWLPHVLLHNANSELVRHGLVLWKRYGVSRALRQKEPNRGGVSQKEVPLNAIFGGSNSLLSCFVLIQTHSVCVRVEARYPRFGLELSRRHRDPENPFSGSPHLSGKPEWPLVLEPSGFVSHWNFLGKLRQLFCTLGWIYLPHFL